MQPKVGDLVRGVVADYNGQGDAVVYGMLRAFGDMGQCIVSPLVVFGWRNGFTIEPESGGTMEIPSGYVVRVDGLGGAE